MGTSNAHDDLVAGTKERNMPTDIIAGIEAGLMPHAFNRIRFAFERHARREKRAMALLGISQKEWAIMREMRERALEQCAFYGHQWRAGVYPDRIVCMRCGELQTQ